MLFGVDHEKFMNAFRAAYPNAYEGQGNGHTIEFVWNGESHFITVPDPKVQLAVGTLQASSTSTSRTTAARWTISTATT